MNPECLDHYQCIHNLKTSNCKNNRCEFETRFDDYNHEIMIN